MAKIKILYNHSYAVTKVRKTGPMDGNNHAVKVVGGRATKRGG